MMTTTTAPRISMIVAVDRNWAIGRRGGMLFHIPSDLRHFKAVTMGAPVVMGRRTWESLPKGALPGRRNVVITRQTGFEAPGAEVVGSLQEAITLVGASAPEIFIIGGGQIYTSALPLAQRVYLTRIDAAAPDADTYFPRLDPAEWSMVGEPESMIDEKSGIGVQFVCLSRK